MEVGKKIKKDKNPNKVKQATKQVNIWHVLEIQENTPKNEPAP